MQTYIAAALVGVGMLSVMLFPTIARALLSKVARTVLGGNTGRGELADCYQHYNRHTGGIRH
jgi:hypothetical protein